MHTNDWQGVDTELTGVLSPYEMFTVEFKTGDEQLKDGDDDYNQRLLRVTLTSTGYAADPTSPKRNTTDKVEAVVQLIPLAFADAPPGVSEMLENTLSQWDIGECELCIPFRVEGPVLFRARLNLSTQLNWTTDRLTSPWWEYHQGLADMWSRTKGVEDHRPFNGSVALPPGQNDKVYDLLKTALKLEKLGTAPPARFIWESLGEEATYRLYRGGHEYKAHVIDANVITGPLIRDPANNPAGLWLFNRSGNLRLSDGATIDGSLFTSAGSGDIIVDGEVTVAPVDLEWYDDGKRVNLPAIVTASSIVFEPGCDAELSGLILARNAFQVSSADQNGLSLTIVGHVAARDLRILPRRDWASIKEKPPPPVKNWASLFEKFENQNHVKSFPEWLDGRPPEDLEIEPQIVLERPDPSIQHHYYRLHQPIYVPRSDDPGLRWKIVRWPTNAKPE